MSLLEAEQLADAKARKNRNENHRTRGFLQDEGLLPDGGKRLCVLDGCGFCPFAVSDLLGREPASANAAAPARRCSLRDYWRWLPIRVPGSHQFATAVWTISSNHKVRRRNVSRCAMR